MSAFENDPAADPGITWSCHFCGDVRPDALISTVSRKSKFGTVVVQENRRYCNDRSGCGAMAELWRTNG